MTLHSRGITSSHFLARNVQCVKLCILMFPSLLHSFLLLFCTPFFLLSFIISLPPSKLHFSTGYPALGGPFNISAGQARLSQLWSATDIFLGCLLKYYTDMTKGKHTQFLCIVLSQLPTIVNSETSRPRFDSYIAIYLHAIHFSFLNLAKHHLNPFKLLLSTTSFGKDLNRSTTQP